MYQAIVFLPLIGAIFAGFFGRLVGARPSEVVTTSLVLVTMVLSWFAFYQVGIEGHEERIELFRFIDSGALQTSWSLRIDTLTAVMLVVVTTVSGLVHLYSIGYMDEDPHQPRFFAYLSLFTFAMLALVTADNLVQLFFGWEGVGLMSYLLIGFWYHRPAAKAAAIKAFIVNRVGDFGFALGIFAIFTVFNTVQYDTIFASAPDQVGKTMEFLGMQVDALTLICLLLFMGAMGKSAQFLLHTWLPDAMEGPTPVSALIHAATMVTAGRVHGGAAVAAVRARADRARRRHRHRRHHGLLRRDRRAGADRHQAGRRLFDLLAARLHVRGRGRRRLRHRHLPSLHPRLLQGAAVPGRRRRDPRAASRAGHAPHGGLAQGAALHLGDDADRDPVADRLSLHLGLRLQGRHHRGGLCRTGVRRALRLRAHARRGAADLVLFLAADVLAFEGKPREKPEVLEHAHEPPWTMGVPLVILAARLAASPASSSCISSSARDEAAFWRGSLVTHAGEAEHEVPILVMLAPTLAMAAGFAVAWYFYIRNPLVPFGLAKRFRGLYQFLLNAWYFDDLYDFLFVRPAKRLGRFLWKTGDGTIIDGIGP